MYQFTTASGTTFEVADSRITRKPDPYTPPEVAYRICPPIEGKRFRWEAVPVVGEPAVFHLLPEGWVRTGIVSGIVGRPDPCDVRLPWDVAPEMGPPTF